VGIVIALRTVKIQCSKAIQTNGSDIVDSVVTQLYSQ